MSKSATIIDPIHPGEILKVEFLDELGISASAFAASLGVVPNRITRIVAGKTSISAETALLLGAGLNTTAEFWMNLQTHYDLEVARQDADFVSRVQKTKPLVSAEEVLTL